MTSYEESVDFKLIESLKCDVCRNYFEIPIMMCSGCGENACKKCSHESLCTVGGNLNRNHRLEAIAEKAMYFCINKEEGCTKVLCYYQKTKHIAEDCLYQKRACPFVKLLKWDCNWKGILSEMKNHTLQEHELQSNNGQDSGPFNAKLTHLTDPKVYCSVVYKAQEVFVIMWELREGKLCCSVMLVCTKENALNYTYNLEIYHGVKSIKVSFASVDSILVGPSRSIRLLCEMVETFKEETEGGTLKMKMEIYKTSNEMLQYETAKVDVECIQPIMIN